MQKFNEEHLLVCGHIGWYILKELLFYSRKE